MSLRPIYLELRGPVKTKKGKEFILPENVDKDYGIWKDYTLRDFGYMALAGGSGLLLIILPLYNLILVLTKIVIAVLAMTIVMAISTIKPANARKSIRVRGYLKTGSQYAESRKLYFLKLQKRDDMGSELEKITTE